MEKTVCRVDFKNSTANPKAPWFLLAQQTQGSEDLFPRPRSSGKTERLSLPGGREEGVKVKLRGEFNWQRLLQPHLKEKDPGSAAAAQKQLTGFKTGNEAICLQQDVGNVAFNPFKVCEVGPSPTSKGSS